MRARVYLFSIATSARPSSPLTSMESSRGPPRVKNKAPAPQQISAEQLLREAVDRQEPGLQAPTQRFADLEELHEFQGRKRKEFEDYVRRNRINMNNWMRYVAPLPVVCSGFGMRLPHVAYLNGVESLLTLNRYAQWELEQKEFRRARSVFERALDVDSTSLVLWLRYIESEMKTRVSNLFLQSTYQGSRKMFGEKSPAKRMKLWPWKAEERYQDIPNN